MSYLVSEEALERLRGKLIDRAFAETQKPEPDSPIQLAVMLAYVKTLKTVTDCIGEVIEEGKL